MGPRLPGVTYNWNELHDSPEMQMLTYKVKKAAAAYLSSLGERGKQKFRVFPWVEAYGPRDYLRPHMHTGAACSTTFFLKSGAQGSKMLFEDVRGINAPFGRTHVIEPTQGELVIFP